MKNSKKQHRRSPARKPHGKILKLWTSKPKEQKTSVRHVLHNLYFSKPYDPKKAQPKPVAKPKPAVQKPGFFATFGKPKKAQPKPAAKPLAKPVAQPKPAVQKPGFFATFGKTQPQIKKELILKTQTTIPKPDFVPVADKNLEKRLEQMEQYLEKRITVAEQSVALVKDIFDELKKDNEALRRERALMLEKISASTLGLSETAQSEIELESLPKEKNTMSTFTGNGKNTMDTSLDQLLDMVMDKGSIKISDAARRLKIKDKQVEEWAKMLEEHGLIEIQYPALGKPVLKKKT